MDLLYSSIAQLIIAAGQKNTDMIKTSKLM